MKMLSRSQARRLLGVLDRYLRVNIVDRARLAPGASGCVGGECSGADIATGTQERKGTVQVVLVLRGRA